MLIRDVKDRMNRPMRKYRARDSRERVDRGTKGSYWWNGNHNVIKCFTLMKEPATDNKLEFHTTHISPLVNVKQI